MNDAEKQQQRADKFVDETLSDVERMLGSNPTVDLCIWWRGRITGVGYSVKVLTDKGKLDGKRMNAAFDALHKTESLLRTKGNEQN